MPPARFIQASPSAARRAFSLIEAAIVLGIVGLVIGGIWIAASAVQVNQTISQLTEGTIFHVSKVRKLVAGGNVDFGWYCTSMSSTEEQATFGLFPQDWVQGSGTATRFVGPSNIIVSRMCRDSVNAEEKAVGLLYVFSGSQRALCRKLLITLVSKDWKNINMLYGYSGNTAIFPFGGWFSFNTTLTGPVAPNAAGVGTICDANSLTLNGPVLGVLWKL